MGIKQKLQDDLKASMKSGDKLRTMALRGVLSEITRVEKDIRREADDNDAIAVIKRERARRAESIDFARKANRADLVAEGETEARVLDSYLPAAASADDVRAAIAELVAGGANQIGVVMKGLRERFGASLDGKLASDLAKEALVKK